MAKKQKLCPSCLERGKETPICRNNGLYCHFCMQYKAIEYSYTINQPRMTEVKPEPKQQSLWQ